MNKLLIPLLMLATLFGTTSCGDDEPDLIIWDFAPTTVNVYVQNAGGQNLLDETTPGCILGEPITLTYKGTTTGLILDPYAEENEEEFQIASRFYPAMWRGVCLLTDKEGRKYLCIGEWQTEDNFNEDFTLTIGNRNYPMTLDHTFKFTKKDRSKYKINNRLTLDGKVVSTVNDTPHIPVTITL